MQNTPPQPPLEERTDNDLIEELCLALRDVGVWERSLPRGDERARAHVDRVQRVHHELVRRGIDLGPRIALLTRETGWLMEPLLAEALLFPNVMPAVREADGIRRMYRCERCRIAEVPDFLGVPLCNTCLSQARQALAIPGPFDGWIVFRTYSPERWCRHANADTILMAHLDSDDGLGPSLCTACIEQEMHRREQQP